MRVIIVSCVYPPEPVVSAQTSSQLAATLLEQGHDITVVTGFPNRPAGRIYSGYKRKLYQWDSGSSGEKILRCWATLSPHSNIFSRFLENISFGLSAGCAMLFLSKPDVIYSNSWPIFATGILMLVARLRRIQVVLSIQDLYPESLQAQNRIGKDSIWVKLLLKIDTWISQQAQTVIVISKGFLKHYLKSRQIKPEKIIVVPNWGDETILTNQNPGFDVRKNHRIDNKNFLIVFGGNIGVAAGTETLIKAMEFFPSDQHVRLLIAGVGSQLVACQELARKIPGQKILFHTPWPIDETLAVLKAADVLILPTQGQQSTSSVPSKLITYMFTARPIVALVSADSDTADVIRDSKGGWVLPPGQPEQLAELITQIKMLSTDYLDQIGKNGQRYARNFFSRDVNIQKILRVLYKLNEQ